MLTAITTRRIAQFFFFVLFSWFCVVTTLGEQWWQLRGWPVNWFLQLDPLVGLGVLLATHTLYSGLLWGGATLVLTLFLGRFFCGWVCPMGTLQQWVGYLGKRGRKRALKIQRNQPHPAQQLKYWLLFFLLAAASAELLQYLFSAPMEQPLYFGVLILGVVVFFAFMAAVKLIDINRASTGIIIALLVTGMGLNLLFPKSHWLTASLQTGLLDPLPFIQRAFTLILLPLLDHPVKITSAVPRVYNGIGLMGALFLTAVLLSLRVPRFYCRFICPLGALMGLLSRWAVWRIVKIEDRCTDCHQCEADCEGACEPTGQIHTSECVLCLNCLDQCHHKVLTYGSHPSAVGEFSGPDLERRHLLTAVASGLVAVPMLRLDASTGANWRAQLIRPPGALKEADFLARCIKCGQCMRICPTNVIHPATWQHGVEALWTPQLNFRIGTSGCQHNCVACGHICPTAALRPVGVDERMGRKQFTQSGPIRIGMAFVDRGRCLPWAMDTPCIVCQENCPVSPKAIFTRTLYQPIRNGQAVVQAADGKNLMLRETFVSSHQLGSGDYFISKSGRRDEMWPIISHKGQMLTMGSERDGVAAFASGDNIEIRVRLQQPYVDPSHCIGCGVCEHECPVQGKRAIRVTADNETRDAQHRMVIN